MGEVLTLTSVNGTVLTDKLIDAWFDANEIFVVKRIFSADRHSVDVILVDEDSERNEQEAEEQLSVSFSVFRRGRNDGRSVERVLGQLHLDPSIFSVAFIVVTLGQ